MKSGLRNLMARLRAGKNDVAVKDRGTNKNNRTVEKWNRSDSVYSKKGFKEYWELLEDVQRYEHFMMTGGMDILQYLSSFYPEEKQLSDLTGLIIGCTYGEASPAIAIAKTGAFRKLQIVDVAGDLLRRQQQITNKLNLNHIIEYQQKDLNAASIEGDNIYDFVFANGTIHHIQRLEGLFSEINNSLKSDGLFSMKEYVGPSYLQFTEKQLRIAERVLDGLPDYLKTQQNGVVKKSAWKPTVAEVTTDDPSEAIRSDEIIGIAEDSLKVFFCNPTGGTILHPLLHAIAGNFETGIAERAVLGTIIALEKTLIEEGVIPSDYIFLGARKI